MASIPHLLRLQIATLFVQAQATLSTRTHDRLRFVLWAVLLGGTVVQRQLTCTLASLDPAGAQASSHERRLRARLRIRA